MLQKPYKYDFLLVNSSDADRTLMSAELFLAGLFPPSKNETWNNDDLHWQPIPVHTQPKATDDVITISKPDNDVRSDFWNSKFNSCSIRR